MVQELHVLKCFSCETFQSHIVKKTNKWECKICGDKQSVKKVYGRGSGKDCRIHTQKLNALRGQKEETESPDQQIREPIEAEPPVPTNDHPSSANEQNVFRRTSKWEEFIDKNETGVDDTNFTKPEEINFTPTVTYKRKGQKRKIRDEFGNEYTEGYSDDFNSVDENYSVFSNTHSSSYTKKIKFNKCHMTKNNSYKNKNVYCDPQEIHTESLELVKNAHFKTSLNPQSNSKSSEKWGEYLENETNLLKTPSQNTTNIHQKNTKVSLKWAKYLEEEDDLGCEGASSMKSTNPQLESEVDISINKMKYEDGLQEGRESSYPGIATVGPRRSVTSDHREPVSSSEMGQVISNPFKKISSDHFVSSNKVVKNCTPNTYWSLNSVNHSISTLRKKSCSNTETSKNDTLKNEFNTEVDISVEKVRIEEENLNYKTISLPVFEQNGELSDSDFQRDF